MTAAAPAPWYAEHDEKFRKRFAGESLRYELAAMAQPGLSDEHYRSVLRQVVAPAEEQVEAMEAHLAGLQKQIDAAVEEHAKTCGPLQTKLARADLDPAERVACRLAITEANSRLEAVSKKVRPQIEAADAEYQLLRQRAGLRPQVENVFCNTGTVEQIDRIRVLRKAGELIDQQVLFSLKRAAKNGDRVLNEVLAVCQGLRRQIDDELQEIRDARLRQLYGTNE